MPDNLALAQRLLDAWNQGDVAAVLALVTPEVEIETPGESTADWRRPGGGSRSRPNPTPSCTA
jgi:ketosteroid isomerase-like protein